MVHLTDDLGERLIAGADDGDAQVMRRHLASCAACADRLRALEDEHRRIEAALRSLDHRPPVVGARAIMTRARAGWRRPWHVAAGIAALAFATAAVAMPGSPIARWWHARPGPVDASSTPVAAPVVAAPATFGITLVPNVAFDLTFEARQSAGLIRVAIVPQGELSVRATSGAVEYAVLPSGVVVRNRGARASYEVQVPSELRRLRVRVGGDVVFAKERDAITTVGGRDAQGVYLLPLIPARAANAPR